MLTKSARPVHPPGRFAIHTIDLGWVALLLLIVMALLEPLTTISANAGTQEMTGEGNVGRQFAFLLIFALALVAAGTLQGIARLRVLPASVLAMLFWCALSVAWSLNPGVSARRLLLTIFVIYSIFLLVETVGYEASVMLVRGLLVALLVINTVAVLGWPDFAVHQLATEDDPSVVGAWRGILMQKNYAGAVCALTVLFFVFDTQRLSYILRTGVVLVAGYFLYRTESKTSLAVLAVSLALGGISGLYRVRHRAQVIVGLVLFTALVAITSYRYRNEIEVLFDNPETLTGRVQIWPLLFQFWQENWILGSGFGSFWNIGGTSPISAYTDGWIVNISSGHNGYLDMLVQTGLPGFILALIATLIAPIRRMLYGAVPGHSRRALLLSLVCFTVGNNLTESSIFNRDSTINVILMLAIALIGVAKQHTPVDAAPLPATPSA